MAEQRIMRLDDGPLWVVGDPDWPTSVPAEPRMLVLIHRGLGVLTTMGRYQLDGNRPPRYWWPDDAQTYAASYASVEFTECPACHGASRTHRHYPEA